jgi:hypothetical protein
MVVAMTALLVALSGTAVAAKTALAPKNSVNSGAIIDGAVKAKDIAPAARTLLRGQNGQDGRNGAPGPQGPSGPVGPAGPAGPAGGFDPAKVQQVVSETVSVPAGSIATATAYCPSGTVLVGGGAYTNGEGLWVSRPSGNTWFAGAKGYTSITAEMRAHAICAAP